MIEELLSFGIKDFRVLDAMSQVKRHLFLDEALWSRAYENRALAIGYKQTISQPYIVAKMTELLLNDTSSRGRVFDRVLDIGSGSGYQSSILSFFAKEVIAIERVKELVLKSRRVITDLGIRNVKVKHADGFEMHKENIKFDGIICAAAPPELPIELINILKKDAKLVLPVGLQHQQTLKVIKKTNKDNYEVLDFDDVAFVPMLGGLTKDDE